LALDTRRLPNSFAIEAGSHRDGRPTESVAGYIPTLSTRSLVEACFRHRRRLCTVAGLAMLITILVVLFMPRRYQATMQLVVLNARHYSVISGASDEPAKMVGDITDSDVNSQAEMLRSRDVLNGALNLVGAPNTPVLVRDKALETLARKLDVAPVRNSNILNVSYMDSSPERAEEVLQAIVSSFVERELALLRPTNGKRLFSALVDTSQRDLISAQNDFAKFKMTSGIASLTQDETALLTQIHGLSSQSASLSADLAEERSRALRTDDELSRHPERITTQNRSLPNQQAIEVLTSKLVELQNKRTSLLTGYEPTERIVQEVEQQISTVENQLDRLRSANAIETTSDINPLNLELKAQLAKAKIAGSALATQRREIEMQKHAFLAKLTDLEAKSSQFDNLQKRVAEAQRNFDLATQKRDQSAVDDALDKDRILNVALAARPSASSIPVQPRPRLYLALGLFAALFFAIGSCAVAELRRDTVFSPAELDALTGVPTVACIPLQAHRLQEQLAGSSKYSNLGATSLVTMQDGAHGSSPRPPFAARSKG
jgi:succinoglycan biosynthesis transport protein ExoP